MPPAAPVHVILPPNTNSFHVGDYSGALQPGATQVVGNADSDVVGYVTPAGATNPVLMQASAPSFSNGKITGVIQEGSVIVNWYDTSSVLYSPDLVNWYTVSAPAHYAICLPEVDHEFFKLP